MEQVVLYGEQTSGKATKLIIDLFNRINKENPFVMKTITTIYKNDDIFKGNARYPIDAPWKDFYKELTEKYVVEHNLDNIFFKDGKAKEGEYYFEYSYHKKHNSFIVHNSPEDLSVETKKSYVPMLYSMITGVIIDWEDALSKTEFNNDSKESSTKVLLVFGKDALKTLEFSWLATFELNITDKSQVDLLAEEIKKQKAEIINFTQGVLFAELDGVIIGFLQSQKQFEHTKYLIKDHKHTLKNFGLNGALNLLYHKIKDDPDTLKIYNYVENLCLLHDYTTDVLYNFGDSPDKLLLKANEINTYTGILELIHSATKDYESKKIIYVQDVIAHGLNVIDDDDLPNVFTVLLNLYSNSRNHGKGEYIIEVKIVDGNNLEIDFKNNGVMPKSFVNYFLSSNLNLSESKGEGIMFIRDALNRLKHISRGCETDSDSTIIKLTINQKS